MAQGAFAREKSALDPDSVLFILSKEGDIHCSQRIPQVKLELHLVW